MEIPHIIFLTTIILFLVLLIPGIIRKGGWNNYQGDLVKYYLAHNRSIFSAYVYFFKAAIGQKN